MSNQSNQPLTQTEGDALLHDEQGAGTVLAGITGTIDGIATMTRIHLNVYGHYLPDKGEDLYRFIIALERQVTRLQEERARMIEDKYYPID